MKVFVVDGDPSVRQALAEDVPQLSWLASAAELLRELDGSAEDCVLIVNVRLPDMDGIDAIHELRKRRLRMPAIAMCEDADVRTAVRAIQGGASDFLEKPRHASVLSLAIRKLLRKHEASRRLHHGQAAAG